MKKLTRLFATLGFALLFTAQAQAASYIMRAPSPGLQATPVPPPQETWNPSDLYNVTLSNNNLTATFTTATNANVRGTVGKSTGKWYWEFTINRLDWPAYVGVGVWSKDTAITSSIGPSNTDVWIDYNFKNGVQYECVVGDVIGVAADFDAGVLKFYKNGVQLTQLRNSQALSGSTVNIPTGTTWYPVIGNANNYQNGTVTWTANFGQSAFQYPAPAGYSPLLQ